MSGVQELLRRELARRVRAATGCPQPDPASDAAPDLSRLAAAEADAPDVAALVVLSRFDPVAFAHSSLRFAFSLDGGQAENWLRAFTRTLFLTGNPANLAHRFRFNQVSADASIAWFGPGSSAEGTGLRRLLKAFIGTAELRPPSNQTIDITGAHGRRFELLMATAGVSTTDYLVHLNHTLAEAALTGTLQPGDRLLLRHVPRLTDLTTPYCALRVHRDDHAPDRLRAYACLRIVPEAHGNEP
ncbi:DUF6182 family protein [Actinospica robiniae]|uniref:DUF6182 family protein n=1 Tax=Actinospica robiniae TaxID=304901 RepID=UPI0004153F58|nr:DUF6182 family protein [Actinospica robiniae]